MTTSTPADGQPTLSHLDDRGNARMVDVSDKPESHREATARGRVQMSAETLARITEGRVSKGDVLATARLAGIMAAKRTHDLIPLCHPLPISGVEVHLAASDEGADPAVEIEALTAVSVAALTVYDMCKSAERGMRIEAVRLVAKSGGRSGDYTSE